MIMLGAIGQSARSTDCAALSTDRAALLKYLLVAQQSVHRATIGRSRNNRSIVQHSVTNMHDQPIMRDWLGAIGRMCRNGFARSADCAGMVLRDRSIVQEWFCAIGRLCRNCLARSAIHGSNSQRCKIDRNCKSIVVTSQYKSLWWYWKFVLQWIFLLWEIAPRNGLPARSVERAKPFLHDRPIAQTHSCPIGRSRKTFPARSVDRANPFLPDRQIVQSLSCAIGW